MLIPNAPPGQSLTSRAGPRRAHGQHVVHGGERGHAGADGPDGHLRPGGPGRLPELWWRGEHPAVPRLR